jgi:hypothetical protein
MSAVTLVACFAIDACSNTPVTSILCKQFSNVNPSAIQSNSHAQSATLSRIGEVGNSLGKSVSKLEQVWKVGAAANSAVNSINQIKGCLGEIVGQGTSLANKIQAVGKLLQTAIKIIDIVKAANAAVAALMSNPWTHAAARVLASATAIKTIAWIAMVAQQAMALGNALSAVQHATHKTDSTTKAIGSALGDGGSAPPPFLPSTNPAGTPPFNPSANPAATPPFYPTGTPPFNPNENPAYAPPLVPAGSGGPTSTYPSYPTATPPSGAPGTTLPGAPVSTVPGSAVPGSPVPGGSPLPGGAAAGSHGMPTVFESGWVARAPAAPTNITVSVGDFDGDGKNEIRVDVPQGLKEDLKINVNAKVGNEEVRGTFDIDV